MTARTRFVIVGLVALPSLLVGCTSSDAPGGSPHGSGSHAVGSASTHAAGRSSAGATTTAPTRAGRSFATPTSTISATATGTPWSKAVALKRATSITNAATRAARQLDKVPSNATLAQARDALHTLAAADQRAIDALAAGAWPTSVRTKANTYIAALDTERRMLVSIAGEPSVAAMQSASSGLGATITQVRASGIALVNALKP